MLERRESSLSLSGFFTKIRQNISFDSFRRFDRFSVPAEVRLFFLTNPPPPSFSLALVLSARLTPPPVSSSSLRPVMSLRLHPPVRGRAAPEGFQGGLNFSYTVGPSSSTSVRMVVKNEEHVGPVWNVIGTVPGTLPPSLDRPVVLGNHRDAWVFGAVGESLEICRWRFGLRGRWRSEMCRLRTYVRRKGVFCV